MFTGAYAVHALDGAERGRFEAHLAECRDCAVEVDELTATAARLGLALAEPAPTRLRGRVLTEVTRLRQTSPGVRLRSIRLWSYRPRVRLLVMVAVLGGVVLAVTLAHNG
jgi:anti-sigma factor RsiW